MAGKLEAVSGATQPGRPATADEWRESIRSVLRGEGLKVVLQPIVDTRRGVVAGYESLSRFTALPGVTPDIWFEAAAELGMLGDLTIHTMEAALARRSDLPPNTFLTVNLDPRAAAMPAVRLFLAGGDLAGIVIELTEHAPLDGIDNGLLAELRRAGARIALDDAGDGYAGLNRLLHMRPEIVKLNRELVTDIDRDPAKQLMVEVIGTLTDRLDAWVIAEGIERSDELDTLTRLGVPLVQGYFLGRPMEEAMPVSPSVRVHLLSTGVQTSRTGPNVALVVDDAPAIPLAAAGSARVTDVAVVVDVQLRPVALRIAPDRNIDSPMIVKPSSLLGQVAIAASARPIRDRFTPLVCVDETGRYVGIVRVDRLLGMVGRQLADAVAIAD